MSFEVTNSVSFMVVGLLRWPASHKLASQTAEAREAIGCGPSRLLPCVGCAVPSVSFLVLIICHLPLFSPSLVDVINLLIVQRTSSVFIALWFSVFSFVDFVLIFSTSSLLLALVSFCSSVFRFWMVGAWIIDWDAVTFI